MRAKYSQSYDTDIIIDLFMFMFSDSFERIKHWSDHKSPNHYHQHYQNYQNVWIRTPKSNRRAGGQNKV